jgi:hypothetical protein
MIRRQTPSYEDGRKGGLIALAPEVSNLNPKGTYRQTRPRLPHPKRDPYIRPAASFTFAQIHTQFTILDSLALSSLQKHSLPPPIFLQPNLNTHL